MHHHCTVTTPTVTWIFVTGLFNLKSLTQTVCKHLSILYGHSSIISSLQGSMWLWHWLGESEPYISLILKSLSTRSLILLITSQRHYTLHGSASLISLTHFQDQAAVASVALWWHMAVVMLVLICQLVAPLNWHISISTVIQWALIFIWCHNKFGIGFKWNTSTVHRLFL